MSSAFSCVICHDCDQRLRYFHVPSCVDRLKQWCDLLKLDINPSSIVCERHFLEEHISKNDELNCCRLNKKAIPTLHLTDKTLGAVKLFNEDQFDESKERSFRKPYQEKGTQTEGTTAAGSTNLIHCMWCDVSFLNPDLMDILMHLRDEHNYEILDFFGFTDEETSETQTAFDVQQEEKTLDAEVIDDIIETSDIEIDLETSTFHESVSMKSEDIYEDDENYDDLIVDDQTETDEMATSFDIDQCDVENEFVVQSDAIDENLEDKRADELLKIQAYHADMQPSNKMLPYSEQSSKNNKINMETSDATLIFYMIDLLKSIPTMWFFNEVMSREYEAGFLDFCAKFSEKYPYFMTNVELHVSILEMRVWFKKIFDERLGKQLTYPQSIYYEKLVEFLPDTPNGKTCMQCGVLFNDHLQYFAHQKLSHDMAVDEDNTQSALAQLRTNSHVYFYARYPLRQGGFSFQCQLCEKRRKTKREFLEHIKTHLDIRDHVCDVCGKAFIKYELFLVHQNRHLGTHKFECKICGKEFTNFSLLTAHRKRYHRPLEGTIEDIEIFCKKRTYIAAGGGPAPSAFHVFKADDDSEIYGCLYCDKTYKHRSGIFKHRRIAHPEVEGIKAQSAKLARMKKS